MALVGDNDSGDEVVEVNSLLTKEAVAAGIHDGRYGLESDSSFSKRRKSEFWKDFRQILDNQNAPTKLPFVQCLRCNTLLKFGQKLATNHLKYHSEHACGALRAT